MYEYDLALIDGIAKIGEIAKMALGYAEAGNYDSVAKNLLDIKSGFTEFMVMFDKRSVDIAGIGAF
jgi:hypothetical protein